MTAVITLPRPARARAPWVASPPMPDPKIIYTFTDEAPALATCSLLPIIQAFASVAGVTVETP